jgi:hypothetical protein
MNEEARIRRVLDVQDEELNRQARAELAYLTAVCGPSPFPWCPPGGLSEENSLLPWTDAGEPGQDNKQRGEGMTSNIPQGFQVRARDHDGNVHDEHWSASRETAEQVVNDLGSDPLVAEAWIEGDVEPE